MQVIAMLRALAGLAAGFRTQQVLPDFNAMHDASGHREFGFYFSTPIMFRVCDRVLGEIINPFAWILSCQQAGRDQPSIMRLYR